MTKVQRGNRPCPVSRGNRDSLMDNINDIFRRLEMIWHTLSNSTTFSCVLREKIISPREKSSKETIYRKSILLCQRLKSVPFTSSWSMTIFQFLSFLQLGKGPCISQSIRVLVIGSIGWILFWWCRREVPLDKMISPKIASARPLA